MYVCMYVCMYTCMYVCNYNSTYFALYDIIPIPFVVKHLMRMLSDKYSDVYVVTKNLLLSRK